MKTLIIGMFSLALVASSAAWGANHKIPEPHVPNVGIVAGAAGVCNANNGALVIVVQKSGNVIARHCGNPITPQPRPTAGLEVQSIGSLGAIVKWYDPTGKVPDPCVTWVISGTSYTFCW